MTERASCELCPYLMELVEHSMELGTTETRPLAQALSLSERTVDTYWKRIKAVLGVEKRHEVVRLVKERDFLRLMPEKKGGGGNKKRSK